MYAKFVILLVALVAFAYGKEYQVSVGSDGNTYVPQNLTVSSGDTVVWNFAAGTHSVTQESKLGNCFPKGQLLNSGVRDSGETYSVTFTSPGTFIYFCSVGSHCKNGMEGSIVVSAGNSTVSTPTENMPSATVPESSSTNTGVFFSEAVKVQTDRLLITAFVASCALILFVYHV